MVRVCRLQGRSAGLELILDRCSYGVSQYVRETPRGMGWGSPSKRPSLGTCAILGRPTRAGSFDLIVSVSLL